MMSDPRNRRSISNLWLTVCAALLWLASPLARCAEFSPPSEADARARLKSMVVAATNGGAKPKAWLDILGAAQWTEVVKADERNVSVRIQGNDLPTPWEKLSREQITSIGVACILDNNANALTMADYCMATAQLRKADELVKKALELSPALAAETTARWDWLKRQGGEAAAAKDPKPGEKTAATSAATPKASVGKLDRAGILREIADFSLAGMNRRLGPDYAFYHKGQEEKLPEIWMAPVKEGAKGRRYEIGGPWTKEGGDFSSTQGQIL
ncbi:MAG: hypothetical protein NTW87_23010, partial [Planctomycetota bacterium]|nr:hypothetical protein [Planctomycetota bacterium]